MRSFCTDDGLAARQPEPAAPADHREGVSGKRDGRRRRDQRPRHARRRLDGHLREAHRRHGDDGSHRAVRLHARQRRLGHGVRRSRARLQAEAVSQRQERLDLQRRRRAHRAHRQRGRWAPAETSTVFEAFAAYGQLLPAQQLSAAAHRVSSCRPIPTKLAAGLLPANRDRQDVRAGRRPRPPMVADGRVHRRSRSRQRRDHQLGHRARDPDSAQQADAHSGQRRRPDSRQQHRRTGRSR